MISPINRKYIHLEEVDSTQAYLIRMLSELDLMDGTVITADYQRAGRGQRGNGWFSSPKQNLLSSLFIKSTGLTVDKQFYLSIAISLAAWETLASLSLHPVIKWPNDLLVNNKKIAGILIQNSLQGKKIEYSVAGIGLNVNEKCFPPDVPNATSIALETGENLKPGRVLSIFIQYLDNRIYQIKHKQLARLKSEYLDHLLGWNVPLRFKTKSGRVFEGIIRDLEEDGRLSIESAHQIGRFGFKEITFLLNADTPL